jgi:hypothetical protein
MWRKQFLKKMKLFRQFMMEEIWPLGHGGVYKYFGLVLDVRQSRVG